jgi:hypothetical protein
MIANVAMNSMQMNGAAAGAVYFVRFRGFAAG